MNWIFKLAPAFIVFIVCCIIAIYVALGIGAYKGFSAISEQGLKAVLVRIWEGAK